jgi:CheY-like chemotaxis protein
MKALVIEDEAGTRLLLKRLLTRFFPHNVLEAADGEAGWAIVERERPAVVFCDMFMPELDGLDFLKRLRAHPELGETAVVAITSAQDPEYVRQLIQLGVADYFLKPIALEATVKRLEKLLPGLLATAKARALAAAKVTVPEDAPSPDDAPGAEAPAPVAEPEPVKDAPTA